MVFLAKERMMALGKSELLTYTPAYIHESSEKVVDFHRGGRVFYEECKFYTKTFDGMLVMGTQSFINQINGYQSLFLFTSC